MNPESNDPHESESAPLGGKEITLNVPMAKSFVYSNVAAFSVSFMDIRISFGEAMPDQTAEARVGIVMPPEHAAYLALMLLEQVQIFERTFGPVRHPQWIEAKKRIAEDKSPAAPEA
jgi:hypothetical protein